MGNKRGLKEQPFFCYLVGLKDAGLHPSSILEFLKLQNAVHVFCVVLHLRAFVCTGPQNSSARINNESSSQVFWATQSRNITRTFNCRFSVGNAPCAHWCFLFPLARTVVKNTECCFKKEAWNEPHFEEAEQRRNCLNTVCITDSPLSLTHTHTHTWLLIFLPQITGIIYIAPTKTCERL